MKPSELFPGAVAMWVDPISTRICVIFLDNGILKMRFGDGSSYPITNTSQLSPHPLSSAVLRGLGFKFNDEFDAYVYAELEVYSDELFWRLSGELDPIIIESAHQLQSLALHLCGVELVWNQNEYETALKEEAK